MDIDTADVSKAPTSQLDGSELVVVSNRQPYKFGYDETGAVTVDRPAGGLTAGLDPVVQRTGGTWVAWSDGEADDEVTNEDRRVGVPPDDPTYELDLLSLSEDEVEGYYYGYSNQVLWPMCHGGIWQTEFKERYYEVYKQVNRSFADAVIERASDGSVVWFQDYHLACAPQYVRMACPDAFLMHFWHITWPGWDTFRSLPHREAILSGLLGNDLIGFHTDRYRTNFLDCVDRALEEAAVDEEAGTVRYRDRTIAVRSFPLGVNANAIARTAELISNERRRDLAQQYGIPTSGRVALGVDRLDYTKGIPERIEALEHLWERRPKWQKELTYVQKAVESRSVIPKYQDLQDRVDESIARVNDRFGTNDWQPIIRIDEFLPRNELIGLYRLGDVMLVSALRDGMNLVAKEYVTAHVDNEGVLVLSDQTGAHDELGDDAVTINPHNAKRFAEAIEKALTMPEVEQRRRMKRLRQHVSTYDLDAWMADIFEMVARLHADLDSVVND
nr:trehalose-6-phosphate synthase [Haladaptatus halobius]